MKEGVASKHPPPAYSWGERKGANEKKPLQLALGEREGALTKCPPPACSWGEGWGINAKNPPPTHSWGEGGAREVATMKGAPSLLLG